MKLRGGIDFKSVWIASGANNFFGEGYPYHRFLKPLGLSFQGATHVAKTTTLHARAGNMPLKEDGTTPKKLRPDCIDVRFLKGAALNAVGLSGPGAKALFEDGRWQSRRDPFFLSFMSVAKSFEERMEELKGFIALCEEHLPRFYADVGIQLNVSCPNVGMGTQSPADTIAECRDMLSHLARLDIPIVPKFSVTTDPETVARIAEHPACDAVTVSNTIPWSSLSPEMQRDIFGTTTSPLEKYGGGGVSGAPLFPMILKWMEAAMSLDFPKPIAAGGGILSVKDGIQLFNRGAEAVCLGSIAMLRPWRVWTTIQQLRFYKL